MKYVILLFAVILLSACEATAVKNSSAIKTKTKLNTNVSLPLEVNLAYYVDKSTPDKKVNFYGKMEEAIELVGKEYFTNSEKVSSEFAFDYLLKVGVSSKWDYMWGGWENAIQIDFLDTKGNVVFTQAIDNKSSATSGLYDFNAVFNAFASAIKSSMISFVNANHQSLQSNNGQFVNIKPLFKDIEAQSTGTGFFINKAGQSITAAHVVDECMFVEVQHKGKLYPATVSSASNLLDLSVVDIDFANQSAVSIESKPSTTLGKQVFVTGYPLSGILSDYPSLTIGNISSQGGLKGAKGYFQFSAPIQPGNSGGAITDYKGNLMGVVSSSLNQRMMLEKTDTTSQNVNFGVSADLLTRFLNKNDVQFNNQASNKNFEASSAEAVEYSNQILCYQ